MGHICILSFCALVCMAVATPLDVMDGLSQYPGMMSMMASGNPYYSPQYNFKPAEAYGAPAMNMGNAAPYNSLSPDEQALLNQALLAYFINLQNARADAAETYVLRNNGNSRETLNKKLPNHRRRDEE